MCNFKKQTEVENLRWLSIQPSFYFSYEFIESIVVHVLYHIIGGFVRNSRKLGPRVIKMFFMHISDEPEI